jgi:ATP-dependent protease ClpP protease subunit
MEAARVKNESGGEEDVGKILIYGDLSESDWWGDEVTPKLFHDELKALGEVKHIHVHINSYGGHVSAGAAIYSMLKQHTAEVTVHIDGFALSAASVVAMAGDTVIMPGNSMMMIHNPMVMSFGNSEQLRKDAETLDKMRDAMISAYNDKSGLSREDLIEMLDAETWFTAQEAVDKGLADVVGAPLMAVACVKPGIVSVNGQDFDLSGYRNAPDVLFAKKAKEEETLAKDKNEAAVPASTAASDSLNAEALLAQGREEGIKAERERQKAIDELAVPGMEEVIAKAKYETGDSLEAVAVAIVKAQKAAGKKAFDDRASDAEASGVNDLNAAASGDGIGAGEANFEEGKALNAELKKRRGIA